MGLETTRIYVTVHQMKTGGWVLQFTRNEEVLNNIFADRLIDIIDTANLLTVSIDNQHELPIKQYYYTNDEIVAA